jgi:hypothetical protein
LERFSTDDETTHPKQTAGRQQLPFVLKNEDDDQVLLPSTTQVAPLHGALMSVDPAEL